MFAFNLCRICTCLDRIIHLISIFSFMVIIKYARVWMFNVTNIYTILPIKISNKHRHRMVQSASYLLEDMIFFLLVILGPYGINGMLIGLINRDIDINALRENWERNYPIRRLDGVPDFVEVTTGGLKCSFSAHDFVLAFPRKCANVLSDVLCI